MSAGIPRIHGSMNGGNGVHVTGSEGAFFSGYQPLMLVIHGTGIGSADSVGMDGNIVPGNRTKTIRTIQTFASVVMIDNASTTTSVACIIDSASANFSDGNNEVDGEFGALLSAINDATSVSVSANWSSQLLSTGSFDI